MMITLFYENLIRYFDLTQSVPVYMNTKFCLSLLDYKPVYYHKYINSFN